MPFDVYNNKGKKIGRITALCNGIINNFLVELDNDKSKPSKIDIEKFKNKAYDHFNLLSMTGKVKEKKLETYIEDFKVNEEYSAFITMRPDEMVMIAYMIEKLYTPTINSVHVDTFEPLNKKYTVISPKFCGYNGMGLVITNDIEEIPEINRTYFIDDREFSVIPFKINDLVAQSYGELGFAGSGLHQTGGYNHIHNTKIPVLSGNLKFELDIKMSVMCGEGDYIYLLMDNTFMVRNFYSNGTFYTCHVDS